MNLEMAKMDIIELKEVLSRLENALERDDLGQAAAIIVSLRPADQADLVEALSGHEQVALLAQMKPSESADVLEEMVDEQAAALAELLSPARLGEILDEMEVDEAVDVLKNLDPQQAAEALREMEEPQAVIPLMRYPDDTAGGLMTGAVITLRRSWTASKALAELRRVGPHADSTYYLFVVDENNLLLGVVGLRELVTAPEEKLISEIMTQDIVSVPVTMDQEECARLLSRHGFLALPVVDEIGRFVGVITADDLIEVTVNEATEDMYRMVGISGEERVFGPAKLSVLKRIPWLAINMVTLFVAITVVDFFEPVIAGLVTLAIFLPLVSGEGGNAGSQTATVIVRGLALGELSAGDTRRVLSKELKVSFINGALIGLGTGLVAFIWKQDWRIAVAIISAMILNFLMAASTGVLIPLGLQKMKVDPALASAAFVTGFTDTFGFLFFLGIVALLV
jgi:magnesium transporter